VTSDQPINPEPERRWHQYSLRTLLIIVSIVAMLCSIGVYASWCISLCILAAMLLGGLIGYSIAKTQWGFVRGVVHGFQFFLVLMIAATICFFINWQYCKSQITKSFFYVNQTLSSEEMFKAVKDLGSGSVVMGRVKSARRGRVKIGHY
jgi:hypothetical protein